MSSPPRPGSANPRRGERGIALIGAMMTVGVAGVLTMGILASFETFVTQSRLAYTRASLVSIDNQVRAMALQPYAYKCDSTVGIAGCKIDEDFFKDVMHTPFAGAKCPAAEPYCGFDLTIHYADPAQKTIKTTTLADGTVAGVFDYSLDYKGTDFSIAPGGQHLDAAKNSLGMIIPREILQSDYYQCQTKTDPATGLSLEPAFQGFDGAGRAICKGFNTCAPGTYAASVDFMNLKVNCAPFKNTVIRCSGGGQQAITRIVWTQDHVEPSGCSDLEIPPMD